MTSSIGFAVVLFIVGFVLLIKGADWLVESASAISKRFGISDFVIALTVVSFGTSMPELIVNIMASLQGSSEIAIGNVLGSNIVNILLILGISALIYPLPVYRSTILSEIPFSLAATFLVGFLANAALFSTLPDRVISRGDGFLLLAFFLLFMTYIVYLAREGKQDIEDLPEGTQSIPRASFGIVAGVVLLFVGGKFVVDSSITMAEYFGLSQSFIGLTIVAIGTSLPELVTSAMAAYRKNADIAIGNIIGSNIFNLLWILGVSAIIQPLAFEVINNIDILVLIGANAMLILALPTGRKGVLDRMNGTAFILVYAGYIAYLIQRG